jgi:hypothetical protein
MPPRSGCDSIDGTKSVRVRNTSCWNVGEAKPDAAHAGLQAAGEI